ncbi:MAG: hypothetical protein LBN92_02650, partial [Treponema sp.]|nr:hypothetical protein [Treponema sp.]
MTAQKPAYSAGPDRVPAARAGSGQEAFRREKGGRTCALTGPPGPRTVAETAFFAPRNGARYLNPQTSMWLRADPAMGEYVPGTPVHDEVRERNGNLPGMGGVYNYVNLHVYHYAGNNPVVLTDPDGRDLRYDPENKTIYCDANPDDVDRARASLNIIDPVTLMYVYDKVVLTVGNGFTRESHNIENTIFEFTKNNNNGVYTVTITIKNELGSATVNFEIRNGAIAFDVSTNDCQSVLSIGGGSTLASAMYSITKEINSEYLEG